MDQGSLTVEPKDGLPCLSIPSYTLNRYAIYRSIFSEWTGWIKLKADWLGYVDLTAGPGFSTVRNSEESDQQVAATPIIALNTEPRFTNLIFVERKSESCNVLEQRLRTHHTERNCRFLVGDANEIIKPVLKSLEGHCLVCVDPFRPTDIAWKTIEVILKEDFCDLLGAYPAPLTQRVIGRRSGRLYIKGLHQHLPPGFQLNVKRGALRTSAEFCREKIKERFNRRSIHIMVRKVPYPMLFCTKDFKLADKVYQRLKGERKNDEIVYQE